LTPALPPALLALTPGTLRGPGDARALLRAAGEAFEAGLRGVLLREPALSDRDALELARALLAMAQRFPGAWIGVHDRVHVALAAGAHGAHLGFRSLPPSEARRSAGGALAIGYSAHAGDAPEARAGADYLLLGPVLDTPSKRGRKEPLGFAGLADEVRRAEQPAWAIGGLQPEHAADVLASGARGLAALSGLLAAPAPGERAALYVAALERARRGAAGASA
jgi:thiamine-phosphate pyrophosphorylase